MLNPPPIRRTYECLSLILQFLGLIALPVSIIYASIQLRDSRRTHQDTLDWNKKTFTESELKNKPDQRIMDKLSERYGLLTNYDPIRMAKISAEIEKANADSNDGGQKVCREIHHLLNKYERLARGISQGIYDEEIVLLSGRNSISKVYRNFSEYIEDRQKTSPKAWEMFKAMVERWKQIKN